MSVTIRHIADELQLSCSTVSAVLGHKKYCYASEETKNRIFDTAARMGYVPDLAARHLRGGSSQTIGLIASINFNEINVSLIDQISSRLADLGYHCLLANCRGVKAKQEAIIKDYLARGVDAVVLFSTCYIQPPPGLCFLNINANKSCDLRIDRGQGFYSLVDHLIRVHGHRQVGMVMRDGNPDKVEGYRRALREHGCPDEFIVEYSQGGSPGQILGLVRSGVRAFACSNDHLAVHLINWLRLNGLEVPRDVAVTGFDNSPKARYALPGLTTAAQPVDELARLTVEELASRLEGQAAGVPNSLPCQLIIRDSCGCPFDTLKYWEKMDYTQL